MAGTFSKAKQKKFFKLLEEGQFVKTACRNAGVARSTVYKWREDNEEFAQEMDDAIAIGTGIYEDELQRRILEGEPVIDPRTGEETRRVYSDRLLEFALKARDRETYGDHKRTEVTGANGGPIETSKSVGEMTDEEKKARAKILREALGKREDE